MSEHYIIYSKATGRVRRVIVENPPPPDPVAYAAKLKIVEGESLITYGLTDQEKLLKGINETAVDWQTIVTKATGLEPSDDRFVVVNDAGVIVGSVVADLQCGDMVADHSLIKHDRADETWSYDHGIADFIEPAIPEIKEIPPHKIVRLQELQATDAEAAKILQGIDEKTIGVEPAAMESAKP